MHSIIPRKEAVQRGLNKYFTGKPCKHGHLDQRYTISRVCVTCQHILRTSREASQYNASYRKDNLHAIRVKDAKHKATYGAEVRGAVVPAWADIEAIKEIYVKAVELSEALGVVMTVDHVVPLKSPIVCGLHCESNLQILSRSENTRKLNRFWPDMP